MGAAASLEKAPSWACELLRTERVGRLGLLDDGGHPRVLPVTFVPLGGELWSAIDDKPKRVRGFELARVRWLTARPNTALTIDRYDEDWARLAWVQLLGRTTIVDVGRREDVLDAMAERYPHYRKHRPLGPLLRMTPFRVIYWRAEPFHRLRR
jgi:PPOX class probable F420-dependent enzyme